MFARLYKPDDYPMLAQWWTGHNGAPVPAAFLPELGVIANDGKDDLAAVFVYFDNSRPVAFAAWFVTKPKITAKKAGAAMAHVLGAVEIIAKEQHRATLLPMVEKPSLKKWFLSHGYTLGCDGAAVLIKQL